jgi:hypothetical protein
MSRDPVPNRMRLQRRLVKDPQSRLRYGLFSHGRISRHCKVFGIGGRGVAVELSERRVAAPSTGTHAVTSRITAEAYRVDGDCRCGQPREGDDGVPRRTGWDGRRRLNVPQASVWLE